MSRLTATQIIAQGDYLNSDFDTASLTVSQLLGVLSFHNIPYPSPYSKSKLVKVFNDQVKPKASKFKKERVKKENSIASDDGIMDGRTGEPIGGKKAPVRRSSRRLSLAPSEEEDVSPVRSDPKPKRRRSSAQPTLGGPSRIPKVEPVEPILIEESEPEEEVPPRKVGRSEKNAETAGESSRRISMGDDSGWEDNNIFQSGAESSSPLRPSPSRKPRKSAPPRRSRKSASAPPQLSPSSSPLRPSLAKPDYQFSPPHSTFEPQLPPSVNRESRFLSSKFPSPSRFPVMKFEEDIKEEEEVNVNHANPPEEHEFEYADQLGYEDYSIELKGEEDILVEPGESESDDEDKDEDDQVIAVQKRLAGVEDFHSPSPSRDDSQSSVFLRLLYLALIAAIAAIVVNFKLESAMIGYCDAGSSTNAALETLRARRLAVEDCNRENRTLLNFAGGMNGVTDYTPCPLPPLVPYVTPDSCTPCPNHATCTQDSVTCDTGYLLRSHPCLFLLPPSSSRPNFKLNLSTTPADAARKVISILADGLPGVSSVAFPPRCVKDPERGRRIGYLGKAVVSYLEQVRGERVCAGDIDDKKPAMDSDGGEARRWGLEESVLRAQVTKKSSTSPPSEPTSHQSGPGDALWKDAVEQVLTSGDIILGEDQDGRRYLAHKTPFLSWSCALTVKARETWAEWQITVIGLAILSVVILVIRNQRARQLSERRRAAALVPTTLEALRNQELAHHTDPINTPKPYLSSVQLRDLILQDEHSVAVRRRLWELVERVVEGNANVRTNLEEVHGGDEQRVWRWVGSSGRLSLPSSP